MIEVKNPYHDPNRKPTPEPKLPVKTDKGFFDTEVGLYTHDPKYDTVKTIKMRKHMFEEAGTFTEKELENMQRARERAGKPRQRYFAGRPVISIRDDERRLGDDRLGQEHS